MCLLRLPRSLNARPHFPHLYGLEPNVESCRLGALEEAPAPELEPPGRDPEFRLGSCKSNKPRPEPEPGPGGRVDL